MPTWSTGPFRANLSEWIQTQWVDKIDLLKMNKRGRTAACYYNCFQAAHIAYLVYWRRTDQSEHGDIGVSKVILICYSAMIRPNESCRIAASHFHCVKADLNDWCCINSKIFSISQWLNESQIVIISYWAGIRLKRILRFLKTLLIWFSSGDTEEANTQWDSNYTLAIICIHLNIIWI